MAESSILFIIRLGQEACDALAIFVFKEIFMNSKEYKTHNQQLNILRQRGLEVPTDGSPKRFLEEENYYNVINGYKDLFLERDTDNVPISPDKYKLGTHFKELKSLYLFDRELRFIFLKYILIFENLIKSTLSHEFTKKYKNKNSYLELKNYRDDDHKKVLYQISNLIKTIHEKSDRDGSIRHYISVYGEVPLWVLVNYLSLGNISYLYSVLKDDEQRAIAIVLSEKYKRQYKSEINLTSQDVKAILKATNFVRNVAAHEERLYSKNIKSVRYATLSSEVSINPNLIQNEKIAVLIPLLKSVLNKSDFLSMTKDLNVLFEKYNTKFKTVTFQEILNEIGILDLSLLRNN